MEQKELRDRKGILYLNVDQVAKFLPIDPEFKFVRGGYDFDTNSFMFLYNHPDFPVTKDGDSSPQVMINKDTKRLE